MNLSIRNVSKQSIVSIAILLALLCVASVFAAYYVGRPHTYDYTIGTIGNIQTYETGTATVTTGVNFGTLDNTTTSRSYDFDLKNIANQPVKVNITIDDVDWHWNLVTNGTATNGHVQLEFTINSALWNGTMIPVAVGGAVHIDLTLKLIDITANAASYAIHVNFEAWSV